MSTMLTAASYNMRAIDIVDDDRQIVASKGRFHLCFAKGIGKIAPQSLKSAKAALFVLDAQQFPCLEGICVSRKHLHVGADWKPST